MKINVCGSGVEVHVHCCIAGLGLGIGLRIRVRIRVTLVPTNTSLAILWGSVRALLHQTQCLLYCPHVRDKIWVRDRVSPNHSGF